MKKLIKITLMSALCIICTSARSQNAKVYQRLTYFTPQLEFNYENKLKVVWPMYFGFFNDKLLLDQVHNTQPYIPKVLLMLEKLEVEFTDGREKTITVNFDEKFNVVSINSSNNEVTYVFRDAQLEFTGKHLLKIMDATGQPIDIYFNQFADLKLLSKIEFQMLEDFIRADVAKEKSGKLRDLKNLTYLSQNGSLIRYAKLGREKANMFGVGAHMGMMYAYGAPGLGLNAQFSLLKYKKGNDNQKHLFNKATLITKTYLFEGQPKEFSAIYNAVGIEWLGNQKLLGSNLPIDMIGFGLGVYSLSGTNGYQLTVPNPVPSVGPLKLDKNRNAGFYYSIIAETQKLYLSYDFNFGIFNKSTGVNSFNSLNVAYKF